MVGALLSRASLALALALSPVCVRVGLVCTKLRSAVKQSYMYVMCTHELFETTSCCTYYCCTR